MQEQHITCIDSLSDDLEIYNNMGGDDREMCGMMRNRLTRIVTLWTDIQREFRRALATSVEHGGLSDSIQDDNDESIASHCSPLQYHGEGEAGTGSREESNRWGRGKTFPKSG